jgi:hypothetical protein
MNWATFFIFACSSLCAVSDTIMSVPETDCADVMLPLTNVNDEVDSRKLFLWTGGGSGGMGNTFVGLMTSFYDAMRSGRRLVMLSTPEFTFSDLSVAFDLTIPIVDHAIEFDKNDKNHRKQTYPAIHFDFLPAVRGDQRGNVTFMVHRKPVAITDAPVIQSRHNNVHFNRPQHSELLRCHFAALECQVPPFSVSLNMFKQTNGAVEYCGETSILRHSLTGPSRRLLASAEIFKESWTGSSKRIEALFAARSFPPGFSPLPPLALAYSHDHEVKKAFQDFRSPIWDCAVHVRVGFKFVEMGETEEQNMGEIDAWLAKPATQKALQELVGQVRARLSSGSSSSRGTTTGSSSSASEGSVEAMRSRPSVYIASETSRVREHVAALIRNASTSDVECEFFAWSGTPHPVDINGNHRSDKTPGQDNTGPALGSKEDADLLFPYLEWWALAHSRFILVRRGLDLKPLGSTFSATAHLYGGWS